jgi:hypothetical protein
MSLTNRLKKAMSSNFFEVGNAEAEEQTKQDKKETEETKEVPILEIVTSSTPNETLPKPVLSSSIIQVNPVLNTLPSFAEIIKANIEREPIEFIVPLATPSHTNVSLSDSSLCPMTALQVAEMINTLPETMPLRAKRAVVRAAIESQGMASGATIDHILADATWGKVQEAQLIEKESSQATGEISLLESEVLQKKMALESTKKNWEEVQREKQKILDSYDAVLQFLSYESNT